MKIFFYTEGGGEKGLGHIARCLSLAQAFQSAGEEVIIYLDGDRNLVTFLPGQRCLLSQWRKRNGFPRADVAIVDSYLARERVYRKIAAAAGVIACFDDTNRINYPPGIIINGGVGVKKYGRKAGHIYLFGPSYCPLRKPFWKVPAKRVRRNLSRISITFGGNGKLELTQKVITVLLQRWSELSIHVIVTESHFSLLEKKFKRKPVRWIYRPNAEMIKQEFLNADLVISGGGQTLYELARIGVPTVAVGIAENQTENIEGWREVGFIEFAGWAWEKWIEEKIIRKVKSLDYRRRKKMAVSGRRKMDGYGAQRLAKEILGAVKRD